MKNISMAQKMLILIISVKQKWTALLFCPNCCLWNLIIQCTHSCGIYCVITLCSPEHLLQTFIEIRDTTAHRRHLRNGDFISSLMRVPRHGLPPNHEALVNWAKYANNPLFFQKKIFNKLGKQILLSAYFSLNRFCVYCGIGMINCPSVFKLLYICIYMFM